MLWQNDVKNLLSLSSSVTPSTGLSTCHHILQFFSSYNVANTFFFNSFSIQSSFHCGCPVIGAPVSVGRFSCKFSFKWSNFPVQRKKRNLSEKKCGSVGHDNVQHSCKCSQHYIVMTKIELHLPRNLRMVVVFRPLW